MANSHNATPVSSFFPSQVFSASLSFAFPQHRSRRRMGAREDSRQHHITVPIAQQSIPALRYVSDIEHRPYQLHPRYPHALRSGRPPIRSGITDIARDPRNPQIWPCHSRPTKSSGRLPSHLLPRISKTPVRYGCHRRTTRRRLSRNVPSHPIQSPSGRRAPECLLSEPPRSRSVFARGERMSFHGLVVPEITKLL